MIDAGKIAAEVQALERLDLPELREFWRGRWGAPPQLRSRDLLARACADRLQAEAFGGMSPDTRRRLADFARRFTADRSYHPISGPRLTPGCTLVREWGGRRHEVKVLQEGFGYADQTFSSLSAVAQHITGVKRSGLLFFGLKGEGRAA